MTTHQSPTAHWNNVKISDVLFFQEGPGVRKWQFQDAGVKLLNVGNIYNGKLNLNSTKIYLSEEEANGKYSHFLVDDGDLLIACSGIVISNFHNKIAFVTKENLPLCLNTSTMRFKALDSEVIDLKYYKYFLQTHHFTGQLRKLITGSAQLNFGPSHIKKIDLPLPPISEQQKIAAILDAADSLRQKDQQLIEHYTALSQSLFLEMFGDPVGNPMGWENKELSEVTQSQLGKMLSKAAEKNITPKKYLRNANVRWRSFELDDVLEMDFNDKEILKFSLENGDLLVCEGGDVGRCAIWRNNLEDCYFQKALHRVRSNKDALTPEYLQEYFFWMSKLGGLTASVSEVTFSHLTAEKLKRLKIPLPPIELQNQYAEHAEKIEEQKQQAQANLEKSETLFNSLLQRAFKGELTKLNANTA